METIINPDSLVEHLLDANKVETLCGIYVGDWESYQRGKEEPLVPNKGTYEGVRKCKVCKMISENNNLGW